MVATNVLGDLMTLSSILVDIETLSLPPSIEIPILLIIQEQNQQHYINDIFLHLYRRPHPITSKSNRIK